MMRTTRTEIVPAQKNRSKGAKKKESYGYCKYQVCDKMHLLVKGSQ